MRWNTRRARNQLKKRDLKPDEIQGWLNLHKRSHLADMLLTDRDGRPWKPRGYQEESLESYASRKVHCDGRDVGKTSEIEIMAIWAAVALHGREMLIATQCENHLYPLMERVVRRYNEIPELSDSLVDLKRSPSWHVRFDNGFVLWGRIAGPRGMNFQGLHVDWQLIDEAQEMTDTAWGELYQSLNGGGRRWVYGVPNGLRNTFFRMTEMADAQQFNWPSSLNPDFDDEKEAELVRLYGGRKSSGFIHRVLGLHGSPSHGVFDLDDYLACVDDGVDFEEVRLCGDEPFEAPSGIPAGEYYVGCDLGYARDPSEFVVYRAEEPHFTNVMRVHLEGVHYGLQETVLTELDEAFRFRRIGIDSGNSGRAVAHNLMARGDEWCEKVMAFEFGSSVNLEPLPDGRPNRRPIKALMTELLQRRMAERSLVFPSLADREQQYAGHAYSVGDDGRIIYAKGNDHIIDADRCAVLARFLDTQEYDDVSLGVRVEGF